MDNFVILDETELESIDGGGFLSGLAGAGAGAAVGWTVGAVVSAGGLISGKMDWSDANEVVKNTTMAGFGIGATVGTFVPAP